MGFVKSYYGAKAQVIFVGLVAFCCPGMFNAMNGLGKAGGLNSDAANMANASLYACFAVFGYFGGFFFNLLGPRALIAGGGIFYAIYSAGMYISGHIDSAGWVAILVGALLGFGAGWFWTAQGAMCMAYATPERKGDYIAIFWIIFNLGGTFGGLIEFGVNYNSDVEEANAATYFTFIGIMAVGAIASLFLICSPSKVIREDGLPVEFEKAPSPKKELMDALMVIGDKYMLLLTLLFLASNFYYTYQFNFLNGSLFNSRTRGLNSAIYWAFQMLAAWVIGKVLDMKSVGPRKRGWYGFYLMVGSFIVAFGVGIWIEYGFEGGYDKNNPIQDTIDFTDSSRAAGPIIAYCIYGWADAALQAYAYWIMSAIAGPDTALSARYSGYYKGIQSVGACVAWGIDLCDAVTYEMQFWIGIGIFALGCVPTALVIKDVALTNAEMMHKDPSAFSHSAVEEGRKEGKVGKSSTSNQGVIEELEEIVSSTSSASS